MVVDHVAGIAYIAHAIVTFRDSLHHLGATVAAEKHY
jgi:hypothetical protein